MFLEEESHKEGRKVPGFKEAPSRDRQCGLDAKMVE